MFRLDTAGPVRVGDRYQDTMSFTIAAPDLFLGSGHPALDEPGPVHLGLIRSTDRAETWSTVALDGQADLHALSTSGSTVYGYDGVAGAVMRSDDFGVSWQRGAELAVVGLDADPGDPLRVLAAGEQELLESTDGGVTFRASVAQPPRLLTAIDHVPASQGVNQRWSILGVDEYGTLWARSDELWEEIASLPDAPTAFTAVSETWLLAGTTGGVVSSEDGGRTWTMLASTAA